MSKNNISQKRIYLKKWEKNRKICKKIKGLNKKSLNKKRSKHKDDRNG